LLLGSCPSGYEVSLVWESADGKSATLASAEAPDA
jgi:hypothetical protein